MTLLTTLALAVALLAVVPYFAHRLRRKRADEQLFPPARLVPPAPPRARRRSRLEDRTLLGVRAASILLLALLGATPFVRCSRLSLQRTAGASIAMAIVLDDSMSMRARDGKSSRFERARVGARELLTSFGEGDAVAIVLAGSPARVALAATTNLEAARSTLDALAESDRATDLDGAVALARSAVASLPQVDRRIVLLSDLADGNHNGPPLGDDDGVPVWIALPELAGTLPDCAVLRAEQQSRRVRVWMACGPGSSLEGRALVIEDGTGREISRSSLDPSAREIALPLEADAKTPVRARLTGADAVATDDAAPVVAQAARSAIAVIADSTEDAVATGGAPVVEQAISALKLDVDLRPLPAFPDRGEDLRGDLGVLLDDPPGLTPEQRHALTEFVEDGGVALLSLGPRAAAAPLGASLEPILSHPVTWSDTKSRGADVSSAVGELSEPSRSLDDLGATRRTALAPDDSGTFEMLVRWTDGAPLLARRTQGRGEVWLSTLPFSVRESDLPLRPAFLTVLDMWVRAAKERATSMSSDVGTAWRFPGAKSLTVDGPSGTVAPTRDAGVLRVIPTLVGLYHLTIDGKAEARVATPSERELDLRPRATAAPRSGRGLGERRASIDISGQVALALLGLTALELALRIAGDRRPKPLREDGLAGSQARGA